MKKNLIALLLCMLLVLVPAIGFAEGSPEEPSEDGISAEINISGNSANVGVGIEAEDAEVSIDIDADESTVYVNDENLEHLRPRHTTKKYYYKYDDEWMKAALAQLQGNTDLIATALANLIQAYEAHEEWANNEIAGLYAKHNNDIFRIVSGNPAVTAFTGTYRYLINGEEQPLFDEVTAYYVTEGTQVIALRLFEKLGVQLEYENIEGVGFVTMIYGDYIVRLQEGANTLTVEDSYGVKEVELSTKIAGTGNRLYVGVHDVSEYLGFAVNWDSAESSITMQFK